MLALSLYGIAFGQNREVEKVHVIFKTHLDIGFTDLSSRVEQKYIDEFIPKAIAVAEELRAEGARERYVWTTGAWLVDSYLRQASPSAVKELEEAIGRGDIVWNGVPYTVESEAMDKAVFSGILKLSERLDSRFGKNTVAAKMTDVPGHTRSIVPLLADAGITFLQIGVNSAATVPSVPPVCVWKDLQSGKEIILMYQKTYGEDMILPDGKTAVSINFTNDNLGPHTVEQVKGIYARLHERYPAADITASSLNAVAEDLLEIKETLPVLTSEIGDTWIYGYGSSPLRMAEYRALSRLYSRWIADGRLDPDSDEAIDFAVRLGMIGEHTWGLDVKTFLKHYDIYDFDKFSAARTLPEFRLMEQSWKELDDNIGKAIALLPEKLQKEARKEIRGIAEPRKISVKSATDCPDINGKGEYSFVSDDMSCLIGGLAYQTFSSDDYDRFHNAYLTRKVKWALEDNGKPGLENSRAESASIEAETVKCGVDGSWTVCEMRFPPDDRIDSRVLPENIVIAYKPSQDGRKVEIRVGIAGKPANRMPEAYWFSFRPENLVGVTAEKTGSPVDLTDVVEGGNRQMHGIDRYVDLATAGGKFRITSYDAPLIAVGERNALNYSASLPDIKDGIHFCLYDNLWGTNFSMWWEGSITYRFTVEVL